MKKKILIIATTPFCNDGLTKIEMQIIEYNNKLIDFEIASGFGFENEYGKILKELNIKSHTLPPKRKIIKYMKAIKNLVSKGGFDSIYIHGNSAMMIIEALPSKLAKASCIITHCHNTKSKYPFFHYCLKPIFNSIVDIKIGCSRFSTNWAYNKKRTMCILNGVDVEKFKYNEEIRDSIRQKLGWGNNIIIGHVGRFTEQKNHKKLIEIFDYLYKKNNNYRLLLIGEGELKENIKKDVFNKSLQDVVCFLGATNKVYEFYNAMDLVILPSSYEGLCIVALEAQANGLPVFLSDKLSPEHKVTDDTQIINLKLPSSEWAEIIDKNKNWLHKNNKDKFILAELDEKSMMEKVRKVLLQNG